MKRKVAVFSLVALLVSGCDLSDYILGGDRSASGEECKDADTPEMPSTPIICKDE